MVLLFPVLLGLSSFSLVILFVALLPLGSLVANVLDSIGRAALASGAELGHLLQLPVTLPVHLLGAPNLHAIQNAALHDGKTWIASLALWGALFVLVLPRRAR